METQIDLYSDLVLPNGVVIKNRLCKAAMEENLCDFGQIPGQRLYQLYKQWAEGGVGLILTGNVMISPNALTGPGGVVLDSSDHLEAFKTWAKAGSANNTQLWAQLSHPGRQVYASMGEQAVSASDLSVSIAGYEHMFAKPKALSHEQILDIIERFTNSAVLAEHAGFTGCQIHAAHGYLISQFLSPLTNKREDQWGGSLENRAAILFQIIKSVRARVSAKFCVSVKLNSADFQKGGFDQHDAKWVVEQLNDLRVDLVELSGGSYESPAMQGSASKDSTGQREAYFIEFAREIAQVAKMPIMITGGIRRKQVAEEALKQDDAGFGVAMLGIARAMAFVPDLPNRWQQNQHLDVQLPQLNWKNKTIAALGVMSVTKAQLNRLASGKAPKPSVNPVLAILADRIKTKLRTRRYRKWRESHR